MLSVSVLKGTLARSGIRRQVPARRRFGNIYMQLGIRARGICNQDPRFVIVERLTQMHESPELFSPSMHFFRAQ